MRMPLSEFLTNGDLKFVIILYSFLIVGVFYLIKKYTQKEKEEIYTTKLKNLVTWSLLVSVFSLLVGLLHSCYFISKTQGIASSLLFGGLVQALITPTLGVVIAMILKLFITPFNIKS